MKTALLAIACSFAGAASAVEVAVLNDAVVQLTTPSSGAGIVVGADDQTVLIATARHLVTDTDEVTVHFNAARHKAFRGRVHRRADVDFAVVAVEVPHNDAIRASLRPLGYRASPIPLQTTVSNIDHAADLWEPNFGVNKVQGEQLNTLTFSKVGVTNGSSGGPLFDDGNRLIGMVIEVDGAKATALKIQAILELLSEWNVRRNLLEESDISTTTHHQFPSPPAKIAITDERGRSVAALVRIAQRIEAKGYTTTGELSENSEKSTEFADMITVHMSLDVTVQRAGGAVAAHILLTSRGGGFRQDTARTQALERLATAFEERLAQEVP